MGDALELAVLAFLAEREGILDVRGADRVVRQFGLLVVAEDEPFLVDAKIDVPLETSVTPELIPLP